MFTIASNRWPLAVYERTQRNEKPHFFNSMQIVYDVIKQQSQTTGLKDSSYQSYGMCSLTFLQFPTHSFISSYLQSYCDMQKCKKTP